MLVPPEPFGPARTGRSRSTSTALSADTCFSYEVTAGSSGSIVGPIRAAPVGVVAPGRTGGSVNACATTAARTDLEAVLHVGDHLDAYGDGRTDADGTTRSAHGPGTGTHPYRRVISAASHRSAGPGQLWRL